MMSYELKIDKYWVHAPGDRDGIILFLIENV